LILPDEWSPYIIDRIVGFWTRGTLNVRKSKVLEFAIKNPSDLEDLDSTTKMSTVIAWMNIAVCARGLADEAAEKAAIRELRLYLKSEHFGYKELMDSMMVIYQTNLHPDLYQKTNGVRPIMLSALVRHASAIAFSNHQDGLNGLWEYPEKLSGDLQRGLLCYVDLLRGEKQGKDGKDTKERTTKKAKDKTEKSSDETKQILRRRWKWMSIWSRLRR
jgi:hypothetical protein